MIQVMWGRKTAVYYICVELANEAGEVVVLEVVRQEISSKLHRLPHDEGHKLRSPANNFVS